MTASTRSRWTTLVTCAVLAILSTSGCGSDRETGDGAAAPVLADGIDFGLKLASGASSNGSLKGNCTLTFTRGGGGSSCSNEPAGPPTPRSGTFALQLASASDGVMILRMVTG
jgi:hypothetical protein